MYNISEMQTASSFCKYRNGRQGDRRKISKYKGFESHKYIDKVVFYLFVFLKCLLIISGLHFRRKMVLQSEKKKRSFQCQFDIKCLKAH